MFNKFKIWLACQLSTIVAQQAAEIKKWERIATNRNELNNNAFRTIDMMSDELIARAERETQLNATIEKYKQSAVELRNRVDYMEGEFLKSQNNLYNANAEIASMKARFNYVGGYGEVKES